MNENILLLFFFPTPLAPSAPVGVKGFCGVVGWRVPEQSKGQLLSYDVHLYTTLDEEGLVESVDSKQTYLALSEESPYRQFDAHVRVRWNKIESGVNKTVCTM